MLSTRYESTESRGRLNGAVSLNINRIKSLARIGAWTGTLKIPTKYL